MHIAGCSNLSLNIGQSTIEHNFLRRVFRRYTVMDSMYAKSERGGQMHVCGIYYICGTTCIVFVLLVYTL